MRRWTLLNYLDIIVWDKCMDIKLQSKCIHCLTQLNGWSLQHVLCVQQVLDLARFILSIERNCGQTSILASSFRFPHNPLVGSGLSIARNCLGFWMLTAAPLGICLGYAKMPQNLRKSDIGIAEVCNCRPIWISKLPKCVTVVDFGCWSLSKHITIVDFEVQVAEVCNYRRFWSPKLSKCVTIVEFGVPNRQSV